MNLGSNPRCVTMTFFVHQIMEPDLPKWQVLGWYEVAREFKPFSPTVAVVYIRNDKTNEVPK